MLSKIYLDIHVLIGAVAIGSWAVVWTQILVNGPMNFIYRAWHRLFDQENIKQKIVCDFLATPIFECAVCHAGWVSIVGFIPHFFMGFYTFFHVAVAVSVSMATAFFITQITEK